MELRSAIAVYSLTFQIRITKPGYKYRFSVISAYMPVFNGKREIMQSGVAHTIADLARADLASRTRQARHLQLLLNR